jgi:hypothetical protein
MSFKVGVYVRERRIAGRDEIKGVVYRQLQTEAPVDDDDDADSVE